MYTLSLVDPALRAPSFGRVRLRKHPTGMFPSAQDDTKPSVSALDFMGDPTHTRRGG